MKFIIVRHGEPEGADLGKRFLGIADVPMTEVGMEQANRVGIRIAELTAGNAIRMFSSPLIRCRQTASAIMEHICCESFEIDSRLMEIDMGEWNGRFFDDIRDEYPKDYFARGRDLWNYRAPGGENFAETGERFRSAIMDIADGEQEDSIAVVVSHAGAIRAGLSLLTDTPFGIWMKRNIPYVGIVLLEIINGQVGHLEIIKNDTTEIK